MASLVAQLVKNLPVMQETQVQFLGLGRYPGEGNGNPLQYSCLENPMDRGAWQAAVHGIADSRTQLKRLTTHEVLLEQEEKRVCYDRCPYKKGTFRGISLVVQGLGICLLR